MADDSKMMDDLSALADAHQEVKPNAGPVKIATGPGSGPQRGRRQMSSAPVMAAPRARKLPDPPSITRIWSWGLVGLGLLLLGLLALTPTLFPASWQKAQMGRSLSALLLGLGFFAVAFSRGLSRRVYEIAKMKDRKDPQAWKIPLLAVQGLILYLSSFYLLGIAIHRWHPIRNQAALTFFLVLFLAYGLWYLIAFINNRLTGQASRLLAMAASCMAALCLVCWMWQSLLLSALFGFFALICAFTSVTMSTEATDASRFGGLFLVLTVLFIIPAAWGLLTFGSGRSNLLALGRAYPDIAGETRALVYSPDGRTLALAQRVDKTWNLLVFQGGDDSSPVLTVPAGDDQFRPVFIHGGREIVCDFLVGSARNLYVVDTATGVTRPITREGIFPTGQGEPWSEATGRFLYTVQMGNYYEIRSVSPEKPFQPTIHQTAESAFHTPSWFGDGKQIAWVGGPTDDLSVSMLDLQEKKVTVLANAHDAIDESALTPEGSKALQTIDQKINKTLGGKVDVKLAPETPAMTRISFVLPAPDGFRLLYGITKGKVTELWAVRPDGSQAGRVYQSEGSIGQVAWTPDGQQVVFEESIPGRKFFFRGNISNVRILDVNVGTSRTLLPPKLAQRAPTVSPDGAKVAFLASSGLWYPTVGGRSGLWVALVN